MRIATITSELSAKQKDVLRALCTCNPPTDKAIARELGITVTAVNEHMRRIFHKLGARSRVAAAVAAVRMGLV